MTGEKHTFLPKKIGFKPHLSSKFRHKITHSTDAKNSFLLTKT